MLKLEITADEAASLSIMLDSLKPAGGMYEPLFADIDRVRIQLKLLLERDATFAVNEGGARKALSRWMDREEPEFAESVERMATGILGEGVFFIECTMAFGEPDRHFRVFFRIFGSERVSLEDIDIEELTKNGD